MASTFMPTADLRAASGAPPVMHPQARVHRQQAALVQIVTAPADVLADLPRACALIAQSAAEALEAAAAGTPAATGQA